MRVGRYERLDATSLKPPVRMDNGFMRVEGRIARVGIQTYHKADGSISRELRLPEEVFHPDSLASFAQLPVTNCHPPGMLTAKNAKKYAVGSVGENVRQDGDFVAAPLMLHDDDAIAAVEGGRSQLSNGYSCELDPTQDPELTAKWGKYDAIMRNIRGNHVALVDIARAGPGASLRLDAYGELALECDSVVIDEAEKVTMPIKFKVDGFEIEVADSNAQSVIERAIATQRDRADAAEKAVTELKSENEVYKTKIKDSADEKAKWDADLSDKVRKLSALGAEVAKLGVDVTKLDASEIAYHTAAIAKLSPKLKLDGMDIATAYKTLMAIEADKPSAVDNARAGIGAATTVTDSDNSAEAARQRMLKRNAEMAK